MQVHGGLEGQQLGVELGLLAGYPADAHAGGDYLGEGAHGGALLAQERGEAAAAFAVEAQLAVGVILYDGGAGGLEYGGRALADGLGVGEAGGILEVRDDVDELRVVLGEDLLQLVAVDAVLIQADGDYLRAVEVEGLERGEVAGLLDGHGVAGVNERRGDHVQRLLGAVRDDDVFGREIHALLLIAVGDKLAQRHVALGVAVLQGAYAVPLKDLRDRGLHLLYRKGVGVRKPAGKGYDIRRRGGLKYGRGEFALKVGLGHAVRDPELHFLFLLLASLFSREWILFAIIEKMIAPCP